MKSYQSFFGTSDTIEQIQGTINGDWSVAKTLTFAQPIPVDRITSEIRSSYSSTSFKLKFFYNDNTSQFSSTKSTSQTTYTGGHIFQNPNSSKKVTKIEIHITANNYYGSIRPGYMRNIRLYRYSSDTDNYGYLTLNIPTFVLSEANASHFEINIDATREAGDDIWFELVDGDNSQTYANSDFGTQLALPSNIQRPKKLRIHLNQAKANSTIGGTFIHAVYLKGSRTDGLGRKTESFALFSDDWKSESNGPIDNPLGWWHGSQRILRDNHYAEGLQVLSGKNFSSPAYRSSTVGFRLVQRP